MTDFIVKPMTEINKQEYVLYEWIEVTTYRDQAPVMLRGKMRNPSEALQAAEEFAVWIKAYQAFNRPKVDVETIIRFKPGEGSELSGTWK